MKENGHSNPSGLPPIPRDLTFRLTAYSTAAGATLVLAPIASAQIKDITTFSISGGPYTTTAPIDTGIASTYAPFYGGTANGAVQLKLGRFEARNSGSTAAYVGLHHSSVGVATNSHQWVANIAKGSAVAGRAFNSGYYQQLFAKGNSGSFRASGANAQHTGYIAFRNRLGAHTYYGWLRVQVTNDAAGLPLQVTLVDKNGDGVYGAFGVASSGITAGQTAESAVPEPASVASGLALMALGAAGVRELRRRRGNA